MDHSMATGLGTTSPQSTANIAGTSSPKSTTNTTGTSSPKSTTSANTPPLARTPQLGLFARFRNRAKSITATAPVATDASGSLSPPTTTQAYPAYPTSPSDELAKLKAELQHTQAELTQRKIDTDKMLADKMKLHQRLENMEMERDMLTALKEANEGILQNMISRNEADALHSQIATLQDTVKQLSDEKAVILQDYTSKSDTDALHKQIARLTDEKAVILQDCVSKTVADASDREVAALQALVQQLNTEKNDLASEKTDLFKTAESNKSAMDEEKANLQDRVKAREKEISGLKDVVRILRGEKERLVGENVEVGRLEGEVRMLRLELRDERERKLVLTDMGFRPQERDGEDVQDLLERIEKLNREKFDAERLLGKTQINMKHLALDLGRENDKLSEKLRVSEAKAIEAEKDVKEWKQKFVLFFILHERLTSELDVERTANKTLETKYCATMGGITIRPVSDRQNSMLHVTLLSTQLNKVNELAEERRVQIGKLSKQQTKFFAALEQEKAERAKLNARLKQCHDANKADRKRYHDILLPKDNRIMNLEIETHCRDEAVHRLENERAVAYKDKVEKAVLERVIVLEERAEQRWKHKVEGLEKEVRDLKVETRDPWEMVEGRFAVMMPRDEDTAGAVVPSPPVVPSEPAASSEVDCPDSDTTPPPIPPKTGDRLRFVPRPGSVYGSKFAERPQSRLTERMESTYAESRAGEDVRRVAQPVSQDESDGHSSSDAESAATEVSNFQIRPLSIHKRFVKVDDEDGKRDSVFK